MRPTPNASGLSESDLPRIDIAEARAYQDLYAASTAKLGTGSEQIGDATAIWYPDEEEAGYNCLINFHRAVDLDAAYQSAFDLIKRAGSSVFGIPVDERVAAWATPERLASLGLRYESNETIWSRRIDTSETTSRPVVPTGFEIAAPGLGEDELARLINLGWDLEPDDARGKLFSSSIRLPAWKLYLAVAGSEVAAVSALCCYDEVAILMLAVVLPEYRGRGLQSYFISERLVEAASRGCALAISETDDDNASPRNLQRAGFNFLVRRDLYSRPI